MNKNRLTTLGFVVLIIMAITGDIICAERQSGSSPEVWAYIGTYTGAKSRGIYVSKFNTLTGELGQPRLAAETPSPSFLAVHPDGKKLYCVNESSSIGGKNQGGVTAFSIDLSNGNLKLLNQSPSGGGGPCHLAIDKEGKYLAVANYGGGSVACIRLNKDGSLGEITSFIQHTGSSVNKQRQNAPHAHWVGFDPSGRSLFVCDLGIDKVLVYKVDRQTGKLTLDSDATAELKPGAGPRHLDFHPNGKYAYVINELDSTITIFEYDGMFRRLQSVSTLPADFTGQNTTAEIFVHPDGKYLYGSNRGHNSISVFSIEKGGAYLRLLECMPSGGKIPRNFAIAPTGRHLLSANQASDNIVVFAIDGQTGKLTNTGRSVEVGAPVCIIFVDKGQKD